MTGTEPVIADLLRLTVNVSPPLLAPFTFDPTAGSRLEQVASFVGEDFEYDYDGPIVDIDGPLASGLVNATCLESNFPGSTVEVSRCQF